MVFFGEFYLEGDNSKEGYLEETKQTLADRTKTEADGVFNLLELKKGDKLMDCPCGYGRHSNELSSKGINVVGCDINSVHLGRAKMDALERCLETEFRKENMIDINYKNEFDAIINMFYSFGFFDTDEENLQVLRNFFNALKPGGKFLMHTDVNIPRIISKRYKFDEERALVSGKNLRIIDEYNEETKRVDGRWIITDGNGNGKEVDYSVRVYTKEEFVDMCYEVGFTNVTVYSDWSGKKYDTASEDMIVIAQK